MIFSMRRFSFQLSKSLGNTLSIIKALRREKKSIDKLSLKLLQNMIMKRMEYLNVGFNVVLDIGKCMPQFKILVL